MATTSEDRRDIGLLLIAIFKLLKAVLLIALGIGAFRLLHKDTTAVIEQWVNSLRIDPDNQYTHRLLARLFALDDRKLSEIGAGTFIYAAVFLTEGTGLLMRKGWAEYLTIIVTASFLPFEFWEFAKRISVLKGLTIAINLAVLWYLAVRLRRKRRLGSRSVQAGSKPT